MKSLILIILLFFTLEGNSQTLSGEIDFSEKIISFGVDTASIANNQVKKVIINQMQMSKAALSSGVVLYKMKFNNQESIFFPIELMVNDGNPLLDKIQSKSTFYLNNKNQIKIRKTNILGENYLVRDTLGSNDIKWRIGEKTKIIEGFNCKEAIADVEVRPGLKRHIQAWFTTEIPLSFGPKDYYGLPGLILGFVENGHYYYASKIQINKSFSSIREPKEGKTISKDEYEKMVKKAVDRMRGN